MVQVGKNFSPLAGTVDVQTAVSVDDDGRGCFVLIRSASYEGFHVLIPLDVMTKNSIGPQFYGVKDESAARTDNLNLHQKKKRAPST